jgi:hypothetical protein
MISKQSCHPSPIVIKTHVKNRTACENGNPEEVDKSKRSKMKQTVDNSNYNNTVYYWNTRHFFRKRLRCLRDLMEYPRLLS